VEIAGVHLFGSLVVRGHEAIAFAQDGGILASSDSIHLPLVVVIIEDMKVTESTPVCIHIEFKLKIALESKVFQHFSNKQIYTINSIPHYRKQNLTGKVCYLGMRWVRPFPKWL
jgi:hypothetical protein